MINLLNGVKFPTMNIEIVVFTRQTTLDNTFHITQVKAIENGSRKRGVKRREEKEKEKQIILLFQLKGQTVMQLKDCNFVHQKNEFALRMSIARSMLTRKFLPLLFQDCHWPGIEVEQKVKRMKRMKRRQYSSTCLSHSSAREVYSFIGKMRW